LLVVLAAKCVLNLAFAGRYGWQRDELYYAVAGRHLQGGYVEFPPVTAVLSAAAHALLGWSLVGFRAFAILAGAGTMLVAALVARELGGDRRAQTIAAVAVGFSPLLIATNGLFQPVSFVGLSKSDADFCRDYRVVARIAMPVENDERGRPIARCTLDGSLASVWPRVLALDD
jgi:hypothetical protein